MAKKRIAIFEYLIAFVGFITMYFFIVPDSDAIYFSRDYEKTISSILYNALHYGNGRLLGNIIGFTFSQYFISAFLIIAIALTLIVILMNKLFFGGDYRTVMPLTLAVAFPCSGYISEVYTPFASFVNFVIPFVFIFASLCILKYGIKANKTVFPAVLIIIFSIISCLFSENTTISIFTLSVLVAVCYYLYNKKIHILNIVYVLGTAIGGLLMILIPKITESSENLDYYRNTASSIADVVTSALAAFSLFADIFSNLFIPLCIISGVLIFLLIKESEANKKLKSILIFCLAFFPIESFFYSMVESSSPWSTYMYIFQAGLVILYAIALFVSILCLRSSKFKQLNICFYILTLSSFGPMLLAYLYGWRTFYLPYFVLLSYAIILLKKLKAYIPNDFKLKFSKTIKLQNIFVFSAIFAFLCLSFTVFIQSVYNYDFYVTRTEVIAEENNDDSIAEIKVPYLPCRGISSEDENPTVMSSIRYKMNEEKDIIIVDSIYCDHSERYSEILNLNPLSATIRALQSLDFKNDDYVYNLLTNQTN